MHAGPNFKEVLTKGSLEIVGLLLLLTPMAYISFSVPRHRGFFCDDQNLKHPYLPQTISTGQCILFWVAVSTFFIVVVETLRSRAEAQEGRRRCKPFSTNQTPWIACELYTYFGYFTLGAISSLLFSETSKYSIGRLRPHFLMLCRPKLTPELCEDAFGYQRFVTESDDEICEGLISGEVTKEQLHEARISFLSGHSSFSFYCGIFLIVYLQARLSNFPRHQTPGVKVVYRTLKVLRPFIQFAILILALWISLTRISDYFHHPLDVLTGAVVGVCLAIITLMVIADVFNKRSAFWRPMDKENSNNSEENGSTRSPSITVPISANNSGNTEMKSEENLAILDDNITMDEDKYIVKLQM